MIIIKHTLSYSKCQGNNCDLKARLVQSLKVFLVSKLQPVNIRLSSAKASAPAAISMTRYSLKKLLKPLLQPYPQVLNFDSPFMLGYIT